MAQIAEVGEDVTITCYSYDPPSFLKDGGAIFTATSQEHHVLHIYNVQVKETGKYNCRGTYNTSSRYTFDVTSDLFVGGKKNILQDVALLLLPIQICMF